MTATERAYLVPGDVLVKQGEHPVFVCEMKPGSIGCVLMIGGRLRVAQCSNRLHHWRSSGWKLVVSTEGQSPSSAQDIVRPSQGHPRDAEMSPQAKDGATSIAGRRRI